MVDLVLEELGHVALEVDFLDFSLEVFVPDPDVIGALDPHQEIGEGKAVVPDREILGADIENFGIDHGPGAVHFQMNDSDRGPDLGRGDGAAASEARLPVPKGFPEIVGDDPHGGGPGPGNGLASGPEYRVAQKPDSVDGHIF
jgi:hypothetical protein